MPRHDSVRYTMFLDHIKIMLNILNDDLNGKCTHYDESRDPQISFKNSWVLPPLPDVWLCRLLFLPMCHLRGILCPGYVPDTFRKPFRSFIRFPEGYRNFCAQMFPRACMKMRSALVSHFRQQNSHTGLQEDTPLITWITPDLLFHIKQMVFRYTMWLWQHLLS